MELAGEGERHQDLMRWDKDRTLLISRRSTTQAVSKGAA
jgi:hypothetical protein